jgi:hypothetical protein
MAPIHQVEARRSSNAELEVSLAVVGVLLAAASVALVIERNWTEIARLLLAYVGYAGIVLWPGDEGAGDPGAPWRILLAGGAAGFLYGVVRPAPTPEVVLASTAFATLLGAAHWIVLRYTRRLLVHLGRR